MADAGMADAGMDETGDDAGEAPGDGLQALYIGHSFGRPFAESLTSFAAEAGIDDHNQRIVFSGGASGAPDALWNNAGRRAEIQEILDAGDVDVLIMICCSESFLVDGSDPALDLWMDYALSQNPATRFVLAMPWVDFPENYADAATYSETWHGLYGAWGRLTASIRQQHPATSIDVLPHGQAAVELRDRFEAEMLPEISVMTGRGESALFRDTKGHAGLMLLEVGTLIWLGVLYDIDLSDHALGSRYETDVIGLAETIIDAAP